MEDKVTRLIIVCCHGIWLGGPSRGGDEAEWLIAPFQREETPTFIEHVKAGLRLLSSSSGAILMFSGGPTRPETRMSEADSYVRLAQVHDYWGLLPSPCLQGRIVAERRSLDSFHNLLFSLTKFHEVTGSWPGHLTIISNEFKRARFLELHCCALAWPADRTTFLGIDPEYMTWDFERAASVRDGEKRNGFEPWQRDMLSHGEELEAKRRRRNPWLVRQTLFENETLRDRSGIHYLVLDHKEVLDGQPQLWEHQIM